MRKLNLIILFITALILFSCESPEVPILATTQLVYLTNYSTSKDYKLPTINTVFLDSENGYFGAKQEGNTFIIPAYTEEFEHYDSSHLNLLTDIDVLRAALKPEKMTDTEKEISVTVLGANLLTNNYTIKIIHSPNTTYIYNTWRQMATDREHGRYYTADIVGTYWGVPSARFEDSGRILKLSRTGNRTSFVNNCYIYDLCRVIDGNTAIMKNRQTGSFICVRIKWDGGVKKVYMIQPRSSTFVLQAEVPYNAILMNTILHLVSFSKSLIWGGLNGVGTAAGILGSDLVNLIMAGSYMNNTAMSIKDITSFGYLLKNFDMDYIKYWGEYSYYQF